MHSVYFRELQTILDSCVFTSCEEILLINQYQIFLLNTIDFTTIFILIYDLEGIVHFY